MVSAQDLEAVSKSLAKSTPQTKPKINTDSLNKAMRIANFGVPKTKIDKTDKLEYNLASRQSASERVDKIKVSSPTIKKRVNKAEPQEKKLVQEAEIDKLISHSEFSADAISFIPYGAGFLTARQALDKINHQAREFKVLQENYLSDESLRFILQKIDKIYDLVQTEKEMLHLFYSAILNKRQSTAMQIAKTQKILDKMKTKTFRIQLGSEISRMIARSGNLYNYYANFNLIDPDVKKTFLVKISSFDTYILKKIKEIVEFNQIDLSFRFQEILEFSEVLEQRNILMSNFHQQVEHLLAQKKSADVIKKNAQALLEKIKQIARDYTKSGKYGRAINRSANLTNQMKTGYFIKIQQIVDPSLTRLQKTIFDLELGNYLDLASVKQRIDAVDINKIRGECIEVYNRFTQKTTQN